jgi:hypothetical protein
MSCQICGAPVPPERRTLCGSPECRRKSATLREAGYRALGLRKGKHRAYYEANRDRIMERKAAWRIANPEKLAEQRRNEKRKQDPEYRRQERERYRARVRKAFTALRALESLGIQP